MVEVIREAYKQSFKQTLGIDLIETENGVESGYLSSIKAIKNGDEEEILFVFSKDMLLTVSNILLFEDNPCENTLADLTKELANIVVGVAKVIGGERGVEFDISTPTFLGEGDIDPKDQTTLSYEYNGAKCTTILKR